LPASSLANLAVAWLTPKRAMFARAPAAVAATNVVAAKTQGGRRVSILLGGITL